MSGYCYVISCLASQIAEKVVVFFNSRFCFNHKALGTLFPHRKYEGCMLLVVVNWEFVECMNHMLHISKKFIGII